MSRILVIGGLPRALVHFRGPLLKALVAAGHQVSTAANGRDPYTEDTLREWGVDYFAVRIARAGVSPVQDLATFFDLVSLMRRVRPDMVLSYTIKPIIYGNLAARFCGVRHTFAMIEGLGRVFMPWESFGHLISSLCARGLYRIGLKASTRAFFLNPDDLGHFVRYGYVSAQKAVLLDGIGIDLAYYGRAVLPPHPPVRFLMTARLLKDKGVREYAQAARTMRGRGRAAEFLLAGDLDENPGSIQPSELEVWQKEGLLNYVGFVEDVRPLMGSCHVQVLPSYYREGTPRTLLEAMAVGRPLITTDAPGCRETVAPIDGLQWKSGPGKGTGKIGRNGIQVPTKDVAALVEAMEFFLDHPEQIAAMGQAGRAYATERYDVHKVNAVIIRTMGLEHMERPPVRSVT